MQPRQHSFSVIVPVLNEGTQINALLEHIREHASGQKCQIIVVDGDTAGSTVCTIRDDSILAITSEAGRGRQMNAGAVVATGDILLFLHADTRLPEQAFAKIDDSMQNGNYVGGAFDLGIDSKRPFMRYVELAAFCRTRLFRIPYGDQAIFIRKNYFEHIGRYSQIPLMEDIDLMRRIRKDGGKICILKDCVKTSARRWEKEGALYATIRNHILAGLFHLGVSPEKLARFYNNGY